MALSGDGNTALVGLPDRPNKISGGALLKESGGVAVFTRSEKVWTQQKIITPEMPEKSGRFGLSLALSSDTALIGAPGMNAAAGVVYVYARADWKLRDTLTGTEAGTVPAAGDAFGSAVALSGDTALVSSPAKAAYVFTRSGTGGKWTWQQDLEDPDESTLEGFASCKVPCVGLSGDIAVVGDPDGAGGTAYVYHRSGTNWTQGPILHPADIGNDDGFGWSMAVSDNTALMGAPGANDKTGRGYVYTFTPSPGNGYTPFATFDVTQFLAFAAGHNLSLKTTFTLGQGSNGINPLKEALILTVGGYTTVIPAGAFTQAYEPVGNGPAQKIFLYGEQIGDTWVEAQIIPIRQGKNKSYLFQIWE